MCDKVLQITENGPLSLREPSKKADRYTVLVPKGEYLQYGGQAIVEGVMMRSPRYFSVAVRAPNQQIVLQTEPIEKTWIGRQKWLKLPFLRGSLGILDAMSLGSRAMKYAAQVQLDPALQPADEQEAATSGKDSQIVAHSSGNTIGNMAIGLTLVIALGFGLFIFKFLPLILSEQFKRWIHNPTMLNVIQGAIGLIFFFGYIIAISRVPDIHRVFKYHGAEHKAINTMEADQALTLENCKAQTRLHPRCGTSFMIVVLILDVIFGIIFLPRELVHTWGVGPNLTLRFIINLCLLFPFAGIAYEMIRFAGKFRNSTYIRALFAPGLATQLITTAEPDADQIEVALTALKACVDAEVGKDAESEPASLRVAG
jgi:uncharacterized protein YqhQ